MTGSFQSMSHSKWDCNYHLVFIPKRRREAMFGNIRRHLGAISRELARQKECAIVEGRLMPDHVRMCIAVPPKYAVASVIGFIKGKSAIAIARQFRGRGRNFTGEQFRARGYCVSTAGYEEDKVRADIGEQEGGGGGGRF
jgi:putative transposase